MLEEKTTKKQNFLAGAAVLSLATMIVKVIGMFFKIPLNRLIGEANYGYFTTAYDIYTVLLMISTTGLPVAMSRMISEARALNNGKQVRQIYRVSLMAFLSIGIIGSALMLLVPKQLANMMENPNAMWSIFALGPAVLFVCYISACRGFFQGQGNMAPTAVSQIIEALCKLFLGLGLAWLVMNRLGDGPLAAAGSIAGVTIGTVLSALYLFCKTRRRTRELSRAEGQARPAGETLKRLLAIAVPITLGAAGLQIINLFDAATVMNRLINAAGYTQERADVVKGVYNYCQTIFNFPCAFIPCITIAIIPAITNSLTLQDRRGVRSVQNSSTHGPHRHALRRRPHRAGRAHRRPAWRLHRREPHARHEAHGHPRRRRGVQQHRAHDGRHHAGAQPRRHPRRQHAHRRHRQGHRQLHSRRQPRYRHHGRARRHHRLLCRHHRAEPHRHAPRAAPQCAETTIAAVLMGGTTWLAYWGLGRIGMGRAVACLGSIVVAVLVYVVLIIVLKVLTYEDCLLLPKGEKIAKILRVR